MNTITLANKKKAGTNLTHSSRTKVLMMGLKVVLYSAVLAGIVLLILMDAQQPIGVKFSEHSYTEYAQEMTILLTTILFYLCVHFFPKQAVVGYLLGGFFGMTYIREHDAFLDNNVADGAWQVLAYSLAALTVFLVYRNREFFWKQLESFIDSRPFGIIITGMLIVFIFSRLFGLPYLWKIIMEEDYMYLISRVAEESIELLGYTTILLGTLDYFFYLRSLMKKKVAEIEERNDTAWLPESKEPVEIH